MHQVQCGASVKLDNWLGAMPSSSPALRNTQSSGVGHRPLNGLGLLRTAMQLSAALVSCRDLGGAFPLLPRSAPQLSLPPLLESASDPELCDPKDINTETEMAAAHSAPEGAPLKLLSLGKLHV